MDFYAILDQVIELLRQRQRVTYRALKVQFQLDDESLEALRDELIEAQHLSADEAGKVLVWTGEAGSSSAPTSEPVRASHALRGEVWEKAVSYGCQAGVKALAHPAYREAV